jgi:hypothetical protein
LNNGIYLVKIIDTNDREVILKLVKKWFFVSCY